MAPPLVSYRQMTLDIRLPETNITHPSIHLPIFWSKMGKCVPLQPISLFQTPRSQWLVQEWATGPKSDKWDSSMRLYRVERTLFSFLLSRILKMVPKIPVHWLCNQTLISMLCWRDFTDIIKVLTQVTKDTEIASVGLIQSGWAF